MRCYICDEYINDYIDKFVVCNNCGNGFHEDCADLNKPCQVCEEIDSLEIIDERI